MAGAPPELASWKATRTFCHGSTSLGPASMGAYWVARGRPRDGPHCRVGHLDLGGAPGIGPTGPGSAETEVCLGGSDRSGGGLDGFRAEGASVVVTPFRRGETGTGGIQRRGGGLGSAGVGVTCAGATVSAATFSVAAGMSVSADVTARMAASSHAARSAPGPVPSDHFLARNTSCCVARHGGGLPTAAVTQLYLRSCPAGGGTCGMSHARRCGAACPGWHWPCHRVLPRLTRRPRRLTAHRSAGPMCHVALDAALALTGALRSGGVVPRDDAHRAVRGVGHHGARSSRCSYAGT